MGRLEGKVAIITGAAGGQGSAEALLFAEEGAKVVVTDINYEGAQDVAEKIEKKGEEALVLEHDVASEDDWKKVKKETIDKFGKIDILVNNAGIGGEEGFNLIDDVDLDSWTKFNTINATSQFLGIKAVIDNMRENEGGSIVNISSIAGLVGGAAGIHYTASKGAIRSMTKDAAVELGEDNIRVNSIHPGMIETDMISVITEDEAASEEAIGGVPLGRSGQPEDVAQAALFLGSDESEFITGTEIVVDGGQTAH